MTTNRIHGGSITRIGCGDEEEDGSSGSSSGSSCGEVFKLKYEDTDLVLKIMPITEDSSEDEVENEIEIASTVSRTSVTKFLKSKNLLHSVNKQERHFPSA